MKNLFKIISFVLPTLVFGYGEITYDVNQMVLRAGAQKDNSVSNFIAVGRTWVTASNQYQGLLASYNKSSGGPDLNFNASGAIPGRRTIDFSGATGDNLCNAITYANGGFIAACRSMEAAGYYEVYLVKFDNSGTLDASFGTAGIKKTGIGGNSTDGHAFVRGIIYDSATGTGGHNGTVVIVGSVGFYSPGAFRPFIAAFDQQDGSQYGTTTKLTGISGTAVGIAFDSANSKYYMASTDTAANHKFYVNQFNTSLVAAASPWGDAVDFTAAISGGAADSVPSGIAVVGTNVITVGANRATTSNSWRCAVTAHVTSTGSLNSSFGTVNAPLTGNANTGITLFTSNTSRDCILNAVSAPPSGSTINAIGTIYNGTNYDYLAAQMNNSGTMSGTFGSSGLQIQTGGSADDVLNFGIYLNGVTTSFYGVGRAQNASLINGAATSKVTTASGSFATVTNNSWTATATLAAPSARNLFSSQWTGSYLLIWGGAANTGGKYDPVADSWSDMATLGAPAARNESFSVWTGSKMVVWAGGAYVNTGGVYDPSANTWTTMATLSAPTARRTLNTASPWGVWNGTYAIFWGGESTGSYNSGLQSTGGMYNVASNTWTPMATLSAPSARDAHMTVWTGTKMLVFGGYPNNSSVTNTGAAFDPSGNSWTTLPTLSAPSARNAAAHAWSGTVWLIWGGASNFAGSAYLNTSAYYNPSTNAWTAMTTLSSPVPRQSPRGVWTGSKFIVWSGYNGSYLNTGGIYDFPTATWSSMATTSAPAGRHLSHLFWTGTKLLVWGMYSSSNSGGLYTP